MYRYIPRNLYALLVLLILLLYAINVSASSTQNTLFSTTSSTSITSTLTTSIISNTMTNSTISICTFTGPHPCQLPNLTSNITKTINTSNQNKTNTSELRIKHLSNTTFWEDRGYKVYNLTNIYLNAIKTYANSTNIIQDTSYTNSSNWAGYVVIGPNTGAFNTVTEIQGSWNVQNVIQQSSNYIDIHSANDSSQWVGIGGSSLLIDSSLIQIGTESDNSPVSENLGLQHLPSYYAWFELLPNSENTITSNNLPIIIVNNTNTPVAVKPNDIIGALIQLNANSVNSWFVLINDTTQKWVAFGNLSYTSNEASAEFIDERVCYINPCSVTGHLSPLQNFGITYYGQDFTNQNALNILGNSPYGTSYVTINGNFTPLGNVIKSQLYMFSMNEIVSGANKIIAYPDPITPDGTSFAVTYNLSVNIFPKTETVNKNSTVHLTTNVIGNFNENNLNYEWYTANSVFGLTPITVNGNVVKGNYFTANNLTIQVNSLTTFAVFVTNNGTTPNPVAYNYTIINGGCGTIPTNVVSCIPLNITNEGSNALYTTTASGCGTVPSNVLYCIPMILNNTSTNSLTGTYQLNVTINADTPTNQTYLSGGNFIKNAEFYYSNNGTVIPSFEMGGYDSSGTWHMPQSHNLLTGHVEYMLKLSIPLSEGATSNVYFGIGSTSTNFMDCSNNGYAPNFTTSYAQCDNGANIFNNYWNFAGTSLPANWYTGNAVGFNAPSVNDGLFVPKGSYTYTSQITYASHTAPLVDFGYANLVSGIQGNGPYITGYILSNGNTNTGNFLGTWGGGFNGDGYCITSQVNNNDYSQTSGCATPGITVYGLYIIPQQGQPAVIVNFKDPNLLGELSGASLPTQGNTLYLGVGGTGTSYSGNEILSWIGTISNQYTQSFNVPTVKFLGLKSVNSISNTIFQLNITINANTSINKTYFSGSALDSNFIRNVEFYYTNNGTVIPSFETGGYKYNSGTGYRAWVMPRTYNLLNASVEYMIKLNIPLAAGASTGNVYIGIGNQSTNFDDCIDNGFAPNFTSVYAQCDNGANVFTYYWNFNSNTFPNTWNGFNGASVSNGLFVPSGAYVYTNSITYATFFAPLIDFGYANLVSGIGGNGPYLTGFIQSNGNTNTGDFIGTWGGGFGNNEYCLTSQVNNRDYAVTGNCISYHHSATDFTDVYSLYTNPPTNNPSTLDMFQYPYDLSQLVGATLPTGDVLYLGVGGTGTSYSGNEVLSWVGTVGNQYAQAYNVPNVKFLSIISNNG